MLGYMVDIENGDEWTSLESSVQPYNYPNGGLYEFASTLFQ